MMRRAHLALLTFGLMVVTVPVAGAPAGRSGYGPDGDPHGSPPPSPLMPSHEEMMKAYTPPGHEPAVSPTGPLKAVPDPSATASTISRANQDVARDWKHEERCRMMVFEVSPEPGKAPLLVAKPCSQVKPEDVVRKPVRRVAPSQDKQRRPD